MRRYFGTMNITLKVGGLIRRTVGVQVSSLSTSTVLQNTPPPRIEKTLNQVQLIGRVGGDPQKRGTEEHPVVTFSLATHYNYKYESGDVLQRTDWHRISVFRPGLRDTIYNYVKKGQRVFITGRLTYGEIKGDDGSIRTASSIVAEDVIFLQSKTQVPDDTAQ